MSKRTRADAPRHSRESGNPEKESPPPGGAILPAPPDRPPDTALHSDLGRRLLLLYDRLYAAYGPQHWWPAETPFEVMVGAVLTQNTSWRNVERAVANLRRGGALSLEAIHALPEAELAALIRPSGCFNLKARRLQNLCRWLHAQGGVPALRRRGTAALRADLLAIKGIGAETADAILLYGLARPVFVIDAYTRRLLRASRLAAGDEPYETLRSLFEDALPADSRLFNEYHALIVRHAKERGRGAVGR